MRYSVWYFESDWVDVVLGVAVTDGACPVVSSDLPTDDSNDVDVELEAAVVPDDEPASEEPIDERPLM